MNKSLISKTQLSSNISDLVGDYGSGYFFPISSGLPNVVFTTGAQLISGAKTFISNSILYSGVNVNFNSDTNVKFSGQVNFTQRPTINGTGVLLQGESTSNINNVVYTTGDQVISGIKIFNNQYPIIFSGQNTILRNTGNGGIRIIGYQGDNNENSNSQSYIELNKSGDVYIGSASDPYVSDRNIYINAIGSLSLSSLNLNSSSTVTTTLLSSQASITLGESFDYFNCNVERAGCTYIPTGIVNGKRSYKCYNCGGEPQITWDGSQWNDYDNNTIDFSTDDTEYPWQATWNQYVYYLDCSIDNKSVELSGNIRMNSRPTVSGIGVLLIGEATQADLSSTVRTTGDQTISGIKTFNNSGIFNSGIDLKNSKLINSVPEMVYFTNNFIISGNLNSDVIIVSSSNQITGTLISGNPTGFNFSIIQAGAGNVRITGSGSNVIINSLNNRFRTSGQFARANILHTGDNKYIMYGDITT